MKHNLITFTRCVTIAVLIGLSSGVYAESYGNSGDVIRGIRGFLFGQPAISLNLPEHRPGPTCSGVDLAPSFTTALSQLGPLSDDPTKPYLLTRRTFYQTDEWDRFEVEDKCAGNYGDRYLIRFHAAALNLGGSDLVIGDPFATIPDLPGGQCSNNNPYCGLYFFFAPHNHLHADIYKYQLVDTNNNTVVISKKIGLGTLDTSPLGMDSPPPRFPGFPLGDGDGITSGWADDYEWSLPCQYVDVTDVPVGKYRLDIVIDQGNKIAECNENNNIASMDVDVLAKNSVNYVFDQGSQIFLLTLRFFEQYFGQ